MSMSVRLARYTRSLSIIYELANEMTYLFVHQCIHADNGIYALFIMYTLLVFCGLAIASTIYSVLSGQSACYLCPS